MKILQLWQAFFNRFVFLLVFFCLETPLRFLKRNSHYFFTEQKILKNSQNFLPAIRPQHLPVVKKRKLMSYPEKNEKN